MNTTDNLDLRFASMSNRHSEKELQKRKAIAYSKKVARERKIKNTLSIIGLVLIFILTGLTVVFGCSNKEQRYAIAGDNGNGLHYIYVTDRYCLVTKIDDELGKVFVDYQGETYSFYGNGYNVGDEIICQFTDDWEIRDVVEIVKKAKENMVEAVLTDIDENGNYILKSSYGEHIVADPPEVYYLVDVDDNGNVIKLEEP